VVHVVDGSADPDRAAAAPGSGAPTSGYGAMTDGTAPVASSDPATDTPPPTDPVTPTVTATADQVQTYCGTPSQTPVADDLPLLVSLLPAATFTVGEIPSSAWRQPWLTDNNWRLHFEGLTYLPPLAARAFLDGHHQVLDVMVRQLVAFHVENPDPGTSQWGWDEGTAMRRLATESCLYLVTRDERLRPVMTEDAAVQLGNRYYGPPLRSVHNHGLMANLELVKAGELLDVPAWVSTAVARLSSEASAAFSALGTSWEQASAYQVFNVRMWRQAADVLAAFPDRAAVAARLRDLTDKGEVVARWLTEPDGRLVQIGDSDADPGPTGVASGRLFRDDPAGYVVGRFSWTDPRATYYTLRYGPMKRAHGHFDHAAVTWSVLGARVLIGPGRYRYNTEPLALWRTTAPAQNVAVPLRGKLIGKATAQLASGVARSSVHSWRVTDSQYGIAHVRGVNVNATTRRLQVVDGYSGAAFRQNWHLDAGWVLKAGHGGGKVLVFRHTATGRVLTITTTGVIEGLLRGRTSPIAGWSFPKYGQAVPAYQVVLRSTAATVTTVFTVT
jgi:hypothetical protein